MALSQKTRIAWFFASTLTFKKLVNSFLIRLSYLLSVLLKKHIHWGKAENLSIEPTNLCNLKCPECPSGNNSMTRSRLFLSEQDFKTIIDKSHKHLAYLQLYFQGEPFMHPKTSQLISYATKRKVFTSTSTNGHFLSPKNCEEIVDSGLHQLIVSVDGTTQDTYEKYRVGGSLSQVYSGIETLQKVKSQKGKSLPHIVIQFVVFSTNEHQINELKHVAKKLNIKDVRLKSPQLDDYKNGHVLMPANSKYNRYQKLANGSYTLKRKKNFKCFRVWNGAVVSANNELLPCCFDKDAINSYGSLKADNLNLLWKDSKAQTFRKKVWASYEQIEMCTNCTEGLKKTWFSK